MHNPLVEQLDLEDDDFSDLDAIISEAEAKKHEKRSLESKQKRLAKGGLSEDERVTILAEIRRYEDTYIWETTAAVALFHTQHCTTCGHDQRFFVGWMTQQDHRRDPNCRRFTRGKPAGTYPERIEAHAQPPVEMCSDCAESCLVIGQLVTVIDNDITAKQEAAALSAQRDRREKLQKEQGNASTEEHSQDS